MSAAANTGGFAYPLKEVRFLARDALIAREVPGEPGPEGLPTLALHAGPCDPLPMGQTHRPTESVWLGWPLFSVSCALRPHSTAPH